MIKPTSEANWRRTMVKLAGAYKNVVDTISTCEIDEEGCYDIKDVMDSITNLMDQIRDGKNSNTTVNKLTNSEIAAGLHLKESTILNVKKN